MTIRTLLPALAVVLAACPAPRQTRPVDPMETPPTTSDPGAVQQTDPTPPSIPPPGGESRPDGAACLTGDECASGTCEGEGCGPDQPGTCAPKARGCTRDLRAYCGCDGQTFRTSGSCPGRRFSARAECKRS